MSSKKRNKVKRKVLLSLVIGIAVFFVFIGYDSRKELLAGASDNVSGWAWSETIGWISFNSTDCDADGDGFSDGTPPGCPPSGTTIADYGVVVSDTTGDFSGYAWSETIGWISFNRSETNTPPGPPYNGAQTFTAKLNLSTNEVSGWARALVACEDNLWDGVKCTGSGAGDSAGGWDGWIKLRNLGAVPYGVSWNPATQELEGWAWGSEVVGWLSFNCLDVGACATSAYKVIVNLNTPPVAENLHRGDLDHCFSSSPPVVLSWNFVDPGDTQSAYQVQVDDNSDFLSLEVDSGKVVSTSNAYAPLGLSYGTAYYWRVQVWDSQDEPSDWIYPPSPMGFPPTLLPGDSFITQEKYPDPSVFDWTPASPAAEEEVQFDDQDTFAGVPPGTQDWFWDFETDGIDDAFIEKPTHIYPDNQTYSVTLQACADGTRCCSSTKSLRTTIPFPDWREISPF